MPIAQHSLLVKRWLTTGEGPSPVDRVVIDHTIRQLPPEARRVLAHHHPETVDDLVRQLENWQGAQLLAAAPRPVPPPREGHRDRREPPIPPPRPRPPTPPGGREEAETRRCFT